MIYRFGVCTLDTRTHELHRAGQPEDSRQVVHRLLHTAAATPTLAPPILAQAEGKPLFLEELARHAVTPDEERQHALVPDTLQALLAARIDRLALVEKHMLRSAAVIGMDVPDAARTVSADYTGAGRSAAAADA